MTDQKTLSVDWKSKSTLLDEVLDLQVAVYGQKEIPILSRLIDLHNIRNMLDVGCHNGAFTVELAKRHPNVDFLGIDIDAKNIDVAKEKYVLPNLRFEVGDVMDDKQNYFVSVDGILERYTVQHLNAERFLKKVSDQATQKPKMFFVEYYDPFNFEWPHKGLYEEFMQQFRLLFGKKDSDSLLAVRLPQIARRMGFEKCQTHIAFSGLWQSNHDQFIELLVKTGRLINGIDPTLFTADFMQRFEDYLYHLDQERQVFAASAIVEVY